MKNYVIVDKNNCIISVHQRIENGSVVLKNGEIEYLADESVDSTALFKLALFDETNKIVVGYGQSIDPYIQPLSEIEILQKELADQKSLINAMLGVTE